MLKVLDRLCYIRNSVEGHGVCVELPLLELHFQFSEGNSDSELHLHLRYYLNFCQILKAFSASCN